MAAFATVARAIQLSQRLSGYGEWIAPLVTRVVVGAGFYLTGTGKLAHLDGVIKYFRSLNIPFPEYQAPFVARLEYYGGILLVLGLFTRPIAAMLAGSMVVALLTADNESIRKAFGYLFSQSWVPDSWDKVPTDVTAFAYLLFLVWLVFYGAGTLSLDRLLALGVQKGVENEAGSPDRS